MAPTPPDPTFSLTGKRILVTGGTRGIGRAISSRFARAGAQVVANYLANDDAAQSLRAELEADQLGLELVRADLATTEGRRQVADAVAAGPLSGFIHCAATGVHRSVEQLTSRHWAFTFAVNLEAFFELVKRLSHAFEAGSAVVGVSSEGAVHAVPNYSIVGATKGGLEALCRHLAIELAPRGIRVNVLSPGTVMTDAWATIPDSQARLQEAIRRSPRGHLTTLEEVASAAHFLCCAAGSGLNGHTLVVDNGERIRR
jgi:NAD(P)-dependent dehydrogenase (short-subunit alcohol dehydrogenase family)